MTVARLSGNVSSLDQDIIAGYLGGVCYCLFMWGPVGAFGVWKGGWVGGSSFGG